MVGDHVTVLVGRLWTGIHNEGEDLADSGKHGEGLIDNEIKEDDKTWSELNHLGRSSFVEVLCRGPGFTKGLKQINT